MLEKFLAWRNMVKLNSEVEKEIMLLAVMTSEYLLRVKAQTGRAGQRNPLMGKRQPF
jgi:hypothetical protein